LSNVFPQSTEAPPVAKRIGGAPSFEGHAWDMRRPPLQYCVRETIAELQSSEDASLVGSLAQNAMPLEVCLTSNIRLNVYSSYQAHPAKRLLDAGCGLRCHAQLGRSCAISDSAE
jgi:hypothetical protein